MNIRIVSDGTIPGTHVYDRDGKEIQGITSVSWKMDVDSKTSVAILEIPFATVDIVADSVEELPHEN